MKVDMAEALRVLSQNTEITEESIDDLVKEMERKKPKTAIKISYKRLGHLLDHIEDDKKKVNYIIKAIEFYRQHRKSG